MDEFGDSLRNTDDHQRSDEKVSDSNPFNDGKSIVLKIRDSDTQIDYVLDVELRPSESSGDLANTEQNDIARNNVLFLSEIRDKIYNLHPLHPPSSQQRIFWGGKEINESVELRVQMPQESRENYVNSPKTTIYIMPNSVLHLFITNRYQLESDVNHLSRRGSLTPGSGSGGNTSESNYTNENLPSYSEIPEYGSVFRWKGYSYLVLPPSSGAVLADSSGIAENQRDRHGLYFGDNPDIQVRVIRIRLPSLAVVLSLIKYLFLAFILTRGAPGYEATLIWMIALAVWGGDALGLWRYVGNLLARRNDGNNGNQGERNDSSLQNNYIRRLYNVVEYQSPALRVVFEFFASLIPGVESSLMEARRIQNDEGLSSDIQEPSHGQSSRLSDVSESFSPENQHSEEALITETENSDSEANAEGSSGGIRRRIKNS